MGGKRNRIGRMENWPGKVARREKMECCGSREISGYKVISWLFLTWVVSWVGGGGEAGEFDLHFGPLGTPLVG